jgi:hypothetical protein
MSRRIHSTIGGHHLDFRAFLAYLAFKSLNYRVTSGRQIVALGLYPKGDPNFEKADEPKEAE